MKSTKFPMYNRLFCTALLAAMVSPAVAAESSKPAFTMMVVSDAPYGQKILSGSFDSAIQNLAAREGQPGEIFETSTNLCVAYAKSRSLKAAAAACDAALAYLKTQPDGLAARKNRSHSERRIARSNLSVALSNRGVLYAIEGDLDKAQESFRTAKELNSHFGAVDDNLARIGLEMDKN